MRKLIIVSALAISYLAALQAATIGPPPPQCGDSCPWVAAR
jgi:hypothetical protein